jgi:hypothetical protein
VAAIEDRLRGEDGPFIDVEKCLVDRIAWKHHGPNVDDARAAGRGAVKRTATDCL